MKRIALLAAAAMTAGIFATIASADKPPRDPTPPPAGTTLTLEGICSFDVAVVFLSNKEYTLTFGSGSQITTGQLVVTLTNLDSLKSLELNISGPVFTRDDNVVTLSGRSIAFFFPGDLGPGSPGLLLLTSGPAVTTFGEEGATFDVTSAAVTDLCAALAD